MLPWPQENPNAGPKSTSSGTFQGRNYAASSLHRDGQHEAEALPRFQTFLRTQRRKTTTLSSSKLLKLSNWWNEKIHSHPFHCCLAAVSAPGQSPKHGDRQQTINLHSLSSKAFTTLFGRMRKARPWTMHQSIRVTKTSFLGSGSDRAMALTPQQHSKRN